MMQGNPREIKHPIVPGDPVGAAIALALVAQADHFGSAFINPFNSRAAYDHVADVSVYVARPAQGRGIGSRLLDVFELRARELDYHKIVLAALARNERGTRLYARHGFELGGIYREQGRLDDEWVDVIVMEKLLT
jgi:phosphinothricin acetyltransferase